MTDAPLIIHVEDIQKAGYCVRGAKRWFAQHGMDFRAFLKDGISADEFLAKGDVLARLVVDRKIEREATDGR